MDSEEDDFITNFLGNYIHEKCDNGIYMFDFEYINPLRKLHPQVRLKPLTEMSYEYFKLCNESWPQIAYRITDEFEVNEYNFLNNVGMRFFELYEKKKWTLSDLETDLCLNDPDFLSFIADYRTDFYRLNAYCMIQKEIQLISNWTENIQDNDPSIQDTLKFNKLTKESKANELKTFPEYLQHPDKNRLAEELKKEYKGEKGKEIRLMIIGLVRNNCLVIQRGAYRKFINSLQEYCDWDIGSYNSIHDYKFNKIESENELEFAAAQTRIAIILENISKEKMPE